MTAPLRVADPIVVDVALGARSYDIVIGRGLLADARQRIAALRPGAKAAIVTDETVAALHLALPQPRSAPRHRRRTIVRRRRARAPRASPVLERSATR